MRKIGLLSDTHGEIPDTLQEFFKNCDEIWHAGDVGSRNVIQQLTALKPLRAVYGNIDGSEIRGEYPEYQLFNIEEVKVLLVHIGGYPGRYDRKILPIIQKERPQLFICGHSHILKVIFDKKYNLLHINPGAAGNNGWHKVITYARFIIDGKQIRDLEIGEVPRKRVSD
ncbi:MAG: metallophosphoesterase [Bacteroidales bacterium]